MRTLKKTIIISIAFMLFGMMGIAQEKTTQAYWIHEDEVKPSMVAEYEAICKELTDNMKKYNIQEINALVTSTADNRYLWVSPISNMADIDKPIFKTLAEKMGPENMGKIFEKMSHSYHVEHDYVIHLDKELSYMPGGITQTPEGQPYRKFHYFHYTPAKAEAVKEKAMAIKNLFASKGSKLDYRVYRSGFGNRGAYYMVAIAAKSPADYAEKIEQNNALLGQEWQKIYGEFMDTMLDYEVVEGRMRPDMGYSPSSM